MARRVFFSFHYNRDIGRIGQIRNSWVVKSPTETVGFVDAAEWESIQRQGDQAIKNWINSQMNGTSVTIVLIGAETYTRPWVKYEIEQSRARGNAIFGITIHNVKDFRTLQTDIPGQNPFELIKTADGTPLSQLYPVYDWVNDNGRANIEQWIADALSKVGKPVDQFTRALPPLQKNPVVITRPPSKPWLTK